MAVLTYTELRDEVEQLLQYTANGTYTTTELDYAIKRANREVARYKPHLIKVSFNIESRTGTATSTSSSHLVDTGNSQFASTDTNKVVYNSTDKTWAVITAYSSTSDVTLSNDIMASGENYEIYNQYCNSPYQIYIGDVTDYLSVERVEYPIGTPRNFNVVGIILTIDVSLVDDSGESAVNKEVYVWFNKIHKISQLTDLAGAVNNAGGYTAGSTSMAINGLQATGTIEQYQEFTLPYHRTTYTVTADATISGNAATIYFYPGLEAAIAHAAVVTFIYSTHDWETEAAVVEMSAAFAANSKVHSLYLQAQSAIAVITTISTAVGNMTARITQAVTDIGSGRTEAAKVAALITSAAGELALINPQVDLAVTALASGNSLINTVPLGGGAPEYIQQAMADLSTARGYFTSAQSYMAQASEDTDVAASYMQIAAREIDAGAGYLNQAASYSREVNNMLSISSSGRVIEQWGQNKLALVRQQLRSMAGYRTSQVYSRY